MEINNNYNTPYFGASTIARCGDLKIHRIDCHEDILTLEKLCNNTDFKKLMPNISEEDASRWSEMLSLAVYDSKDGGNVSYVETIGNKICGIITYFPGSTTIIDCVCTIPVKVGEKVKLAGKTLFYQVFKDFLENNGSRIKLSAITDGPFCTIDKYTPLGFKTTSEGTKTTVAMEVNKFKVKEIFEELKNIIHYTPKNEEKVNLKAFVNS